MRRFFIVFIGVVFLFLSFSCREDFSPKTTFKSMYVLDCYINVDYDMYISSQVYATVGKLYDVNGFDPSQNNVDPQVSGAEVSLEYRDGIYNLTQETDSTSLTRYGTQKIYYTTSIQNMYPNFNVTVYAKMPDGTVLSSQTKLLDAVQLKVSYVPRGGFTTNINRFLWGDALTFTWGEVENRLFFPELVIEYTKEVSPNNYVIMDKQVPNTLIYSNGHYTGVYPTYTTGSSMSFDYPAIDSTMAHVADGDTAKSKYSSFHLKFNLTEFDASLTKYYSSIHGSLDNYSISLDESVYSNIKGGIGIFGSKRTVSMGISFSSDYLKSFGFQ